MTIHNPKNIYDMQKIMHQLLKNKRRRRRESVLVSNEFMHDLVKTVISLQNRVDELESIND
jgi:hypothetical protein